MNEKEALYREFESGSTRSSMDGKYEYSGFISPIVLKRFAEYMHLHRMQADGSIRESRNWQKGIPAASYEDSMVRHVVDMWLHQEGFGEEATEDLETALCGIIFNASGMLFEILKGKRNGKLERKSSVSGTCSSCIR